MDVDHNRESNGDMISVIDRELRSAAPLTSRRARESCRWARQECERDRRGGPEASGALAQGRPGARAGVPRLLRHAALQRPRGLHHVGRAHRRCRHGVHRRGFATLVAACIAVGAHKLAELAERFGVQGEPISLTVFVFIIASAATFLRFIPEIKAKYDYGVTIFILTFSLVAVSSYRVEELIQLAHDRFYTIVVGVFICLLITVLVFPVWAGEGVHKLAVGNLDKLARFFEGMESECFGENTVTDNWEKKDFLQEYKSVLNSKATEDSLCTFANWEPRHGKFRFRHPWSQYQKLGTLCRQCASSMEALASYVITTTKTQYPAAASPDLSSKVRKTCGEMSSHSAKVLRQLATATQTMTVPPPANLAVSAAMTAAECLRSELAENAAILQVMHVAVTASLLADLVAQVKEIAECVDVLARHADFKNPEDARRDVAVDSQGRSGPLPDVVIQRAE
uniref:Uncharacterized protein n=1 Tax=Avena sativa TaxID=4498 RepID=A0ACD5UXD1_AVESA